MDNSVLAFYDLHWSPLNIVVIAFCCGWWSSGYGSTATAMAISNFGTPTTWMQQQMISVITTMHWRSSDRPHNWVILKSNAQQQIALRTAFCFGRIAHRIGQWVWVAAVQWVQQCRGLVGVQQQCRGGGQKSLAPFCNSNVALFLLRLMHSILMTAMTLMMMTAVGRKCHDEWLCSTSGHKFATWPSPGR